MNTMTKIENTQGSQTFSEEELRKGLETLFFAYREFISDADAVLEKYKFGRAHHRVIYFVGRYPHLNVGQLLSLLKITKQSLARVLKKLIETGFIIQKTSSSDHRQRLLELTEKGQKLEQQLWENQRRRLLKSYQENPESIDGYLKALMGMVSENDRERIHEYTTNPQASLNVLKLRK
jgi:DNA-binding MarR family transcriptional regulator